MFARRAKDVQRCLKNIDSFTGGQATVLAWDSDHLRYLKIEIAPNDGPYKGGKFQFEIKLENHYPKHPPSVTCLTRIYHPNIDDMSTDPNVCVSVIGNDWRSSYGLEEVIQGLLYLFHHPNLEDPLSIHFDGCEDYDAFVRNVRDSLLGQPIGDVEFARNWHEDEDKPDGERSVPQNDSSVIENGSDSLLLPPTIENFSSKASSDTTVINAILDRVECLLKEGPPQEEGDEFSDNASTCSDEDEDATGYSEDLFSTDSFYSYNGDVLGEWHSGYKSDEDDDDSHLEEYYGDGELDDDTLVDDSFSTPQEIAFDGSLSRLFMQFGGWIVNSFRTFFFYDESYLRRVRRVETLCRVLECADVSGKESELPKFLIKMPLYRSMPFFRSPVDFSFGLVADLAYAFVNRYFVNIYNGYLFRNYVSNRLLYKYKSAEVIMAVTN